MAKSSFVLQALKILGLEEMLKLSEVLHEKQVPLKKAAGEELIAWDDAEEKRPKPKKVRPETEARVLEFPKKNIGQMPSLREEHKPSAANHEEDSGDLMASDVVLWQREMSKQAEGNILKLDAFKGYKKSTEMYMVKTPSSVDGKDKIRFASTKGVLINKKQA